MAGNTATQEPRPRLSALMRQGLEMLGGRQAFGAWSRKKAGTEKYEACALGCAIIGFGYAPEKLQGMVDGQVAKRTEEVIYKEILGKESMEDATFFAPDKSRDESIIQWVISRNDNDHWSVERIADTLEAAGY